MILSITNKKNNLIDKIFLKLKEEINNNIFSSAGENDRIIRFEFEIEDMDPLTWLINQNDQVKIYWAGRDKELELSGIGKADEISDKKFPDLKSALNTLKNRVRNSDHNLRYFGGIAFSQEGEIYPFWQQFGKFYFILPRFELFRYLQKTYFAVNIYMGHNFSLQKDAYQILELFKKIEFNKPGCVPEKIDIINRTDSPDKAAWMENVKQAVNSLKETDIKKIVLARKTLFKTPKMVNPLHLLLLLKKVNNHTYDFCLQPDKNKAFLGCSPEMLFKRTGNVILSEAMAGSIACHNNNEKNRKSGTTLLSSKKDIEEHQYVFDNIYKDLKSICKEIEILNKRDVLTLSYVQHICSQFKGILKPTISISEIITTLHPTPAVFGYPEKGLLAEIKKYEPFDRGWYASPLGWIGKSDAEFAVGIRSGLVNGKVISLFSGVGIVKGSQPQLEWEEIENKISHFLMIFK
ncbi:MAG: isochorismate synthase [Actinobacteria bacterium]|nr:isochorismate synthase [Actinomycetota bacterium]